LKIVNKSINQIKIVPRETQADLKAEKIMRLFHVKHKRLKFRKVFSYSKENNF